MIGRVGANIASLACGRTAATTSRELARRRRIQAGGLVTGSPWHPFLKTATLDSRRSFWCVITTLGVI